MPTKPVKKAPRNPPRTAGRAHKKPVESGDVPLRIARRERRRERSREEIVEAARRVLLSKGIAATTLEAVAEEVGLTKAALYYYYPSKDALLFEIVFAIVERQARALHAGVEASTGGADALRAIVRETMDTFATRLDDFRLTYLFSQVAGPGAVQVSAAQFARLRPLNELSFAGAARRLANEWKAAPGRAQVDPRLMAFLANTSALGLLTMKGMVETVGDPLLYSDEQLTEGLARIFEAAAAP